MIITLLNSRWFIIHVREVVKLKVLYTDLLLIALNSIGIDLCVRLP